MCMWVCLSVIKYPNASSCVCKQAVKAVKFVCMARRSYPLQHT